MNKTFKSWKFETRKKKKKKKKRLKVKFERLSDRELREAQEEFHYG